MAISALRTAARSAPEISPILTELINGEKSKDNIIHTWNPQENENFGYFSNIMANQKESHNQQYFQH